MMMKKLFGMAAATVLMCPGSAALADVEAFNEAFSKANDTRKQAAEMNHEWRDTAKVLKNAQKAAEAGDFDKAMALVAQAQLQSEQAIVQADRESKLWQSRIIR